MAARVELHHIPLYTQNVKETASKIENIAKMSDEDVIQASYNKTKADMKKNKAVKLSNAMFPAAIGAYVLTDTIRATGGPSDKILKGLGSLASWLILLKSYDIAGNASEKLAQKTDNKKAMAGIKIGGTIGGAIALTAVVTNAINTGITKFVKELPETTAELTKIADNFDKKFLGNNAVKAIKKHITDPIKTFAKKHPDLTKGISSNAKFLMFIGFIAGQAILAGKIAKEEQKTMQKNVENAFMTREEAKTASELISYDVHPYKDIESVDVLPIIDAAENNKDINKATQSVLK